MLFDDLFTGVWCFCECAGTQINAANIIWRYFLNLSAKHGEGSITTHLYVHCTFFMTANLLDDPLVRLCCTCHQYRRRREGRSLQVRYASQSTNCRKEHAARNTTIIERYGSQLVKCTQNLLTPAANVDTSVFEKTR